MDIPHSIDEQMNFFWWDFDEVIVMGATIGLGILMSSFWLMVGGYLFVWMFGQYKSGELPGVLLHKCYWLGIAQLNKIFKNGLIREWLE